MSRRLLTFLLALCLVHAGCQSTRRVPPAHGADAGLVEERHVDRKAVLDWCEREPAARYTMYVLGLTAIAAGFVALFSLGAFEDDDSHHP